MSKVIRCFMRSMTPVAVMLLGLSSLVSAAEPNDPERALALPTQGRDPSPLRYAAGDDGKLRIIAFGAHPDDCEIKAGGAAAMWAAQGHHVKFVSTTNGDIGHPNMAGGPLALRRTAEVQEAAKILGIVTEVLDIHDGEIMPTLENRRTIARLIRDWQADIVLGHRPNDYHPDHRYTGVLLQDAAFMVTVPFFTPDVPPVNKNPVFLYYSDRFQKPNPFMPDIVVAIDDIIDKKLDALLVMESQVEALWATGGFEGIMTPKSKADKLVRENFRKRFEATANNYREKLIELYGSREGKRVKYAEAFELCEYGSQPTPAELKALFPIVGK